MVPVIEDQLQVQHAALEMNEEQRLFRRRQPWGVNLFDLAHSRGQALKEWLGLTPKKETRASGF